MSKKANPTVIGLFILIGVALLVAGLLLFTSSRLFAPSTSAIIYFDNTLNGLNEGAAVKFRGVTIGSVSQVMIRYNQATNDQAMPVIIELQQDLIRRRIVGSMGLRSLKDVDQAVRQGLRARLETESFVTGVLYVELEREDSPPPPVFHQLKPVYQEIPSRPTDIQKLLANLAKIDLTDLQQKVSRLADTADKLLASLKMEEINSGLTNLLISANRVVNDQNLTNSFASLKGALEQYRLLGANADTNTLQQLNLALKDFRGGMENFRDMLSADSALRNQLSQVLSELTEAAQSVSTFATYLNNHPNALLNGRRPVPKTDK
jgi:paraquat-inducible protein B